MLEEAVLVVEKGVAKRGEEEEVRGEEEREEAPPPAVRLPVLATASGGDMVVSVKSPAA